MNATSALSPLSRRRWTAAAVLLATLFGGTLRFYGLGTPGLWLDEIIMYDFATKAQEQPWHHWLTGLEFENGPLYLGSLLAARHVPGVERRETSDRLAAAVVGTLTIPLVAVAATLAGGAVAGVAAAWLLAVAPFHVFYSREGRTYALLTLFSTLALLAFLARRRRTSARLGWGVALAAPYIAVSAFQVLSGSLLTAGLCALADRDSRTPADRRRWARLAAAAVVGLVLYALLYGHYPRGPQFGDFPPQHGKLVIDILNGFAAGYLWRVGGISPLTGVYAAFALVGFAALWRRGGRSPEARVHAAALAGFVLCIAVPAWLGMQLSNHFFTLRYFTPVLPAYLILAAIGIAATARGIARATARLGKAAAPSQWMAPIVALAVVLTLVVGNFGTAVACPYEKADWLGAARHIAVRARPQEPVFASNDWTQECLDFYLRVHPRMATVVQLPEAADEAAALTAPVERFWVVRGGYPNRGPLKQWMKRFNPVWSGRSEGIVVYRQR